MLDPRQIELVEILESHKVAHARLRRIADNKGTPATALPRFQSNYTTNPDAREKVGVLDACNEIRFYLAASLLTQVGNHVAPGTIVNFLDEVQSAPVVQLASGLRYIRLPDVMLVQVPPSFGPRERGLVASDMQLVYDASGRKRSFVVDFSGTTQVPHALWCTLLGYKDCLATSQKTMSLVWVPRVVADAAAQSRLINLFQLRFVAGHYFSREVIRTLSRN